MIGLEQVTDKEQIKTMLFRDGLEQAITGAENKDTWEPGTEETYWFRVTKNYTPVGVFLVKPTSDSSATFHGGLYRFARVGYSGEWLKEALQIFREHVKDYHVFWTMVNKNNQPIQRTLADAGFKQIGIVPSGYSTGDMLLYSEDK